MTRRLYYAKWVLPIASPPIRDGVVVVEDDKVSFVGPRDKELSDSNSDEHDLGEAALLPGFVNVHSHLELTIMRGFLEDLPFRDWIVKLTRTKYEQLTHEDLLCSAMLGAAEAMRSGITTLADTGDTASAFEALVSSGLRGIAYREVFGPDPVNAFESLTGLKTKVEEMRRRETALVRVGVSPHAPFTVSGDLFSRVANFAREASLDICIHAAESESERRFLLTGDGEFADGLRSRGIAWVPPGMSAVRYLHQLQVLESAPLLVHCVTVDDSDLVLLGESGARVAHCPKSNAKLGHGIAPAGKMLDAGIPLGLGTDSVASNNSCDLIEEGRFCSLIHRADAHSFTDFPASTILRLMTLGGAEALGLQDQIGSLEAGKQADIISIDLSQTHNTPVHDPSAAIVYASRSSDVTMTMVAGRILLDARMLQTVDEQALKLRADEALSRMT
jgi:cytosine/adenosine deaminase-related metal-dependent hydrolase